MCGWARKEEPIQAASLMAPLVAQDHKFCIPPPGISVLSIAPKHRLYLASSR